MSKTGKSSVGPELDPEIIDKRHKKYRQELVANNKIYLKNSRFCCSKCGSIDMRRNNHMYENRRFFCNCCKTYCKYVYDKKKGIELHIDEYFEVIDEIMEEKNE